MFDDTPPTEGEPFKVGVISDGSAKEPLRFVANPIAIEKFIRRQPGGQHLAEGVVHTASQTAHFDSPRRTRRTQVDRCLTPTYYGEEAMGFALNCCLGLLA
jgi:hypothetical protein